METSAYHTTFEKEDNYWWHAARRRIICHLRKKLSQTDHSTILNLGCGAGGLSQDLSSAGTVWSLDFSNEALKLCQRRELSHLVQGNGGELPFQENSFDEIYALDLLEHLEDDLAGAKDICRTLKPKTGFAILTVPAYQFMWSHMDTLAHHYRRYTYTSFKQVLCEAGFHIEHLSYFNTFLFPLALIFKLLEKKPKQNDPESFLPTLPTPINATFKTIYSLERHFLNKIKFPFGVSLLAILKKI